MNWDDFAIPLLDAHRSLPNRATVLARFVEALRSRLSR
jgi:hypothetical protein